MDEEQVSRLVQAIREHPMMPKPRTEIHMPQELQRASLTTVLVDANNGVTRAIRVQTLSPEFSRRLAAAVRRQAAANFDQAEFDDQLNRLYQCQTKALIARADYKTKGGF